MEFDDNIFELHADFCSLFSNVIRMKIFWVLKETGECRVNDLAQAIGTSAPNISQHLRMMRDRLAVTVRKQGREMYYRIANDNFTAGAALIRKGVLEEIQKKSRDFEDSQDYKIKHLKLTEY